MKTARERATDVGANSPTPDATRRLRGTVRAPIERRRATPTASANVFMSSDANTHNMAAREGGGSPFTPPASTITGSEDQRGSREQQQPRICPRERGPFLRRASIRSGFSWPRLDYKVKPKQSYGGQRRFGGPPKAKQVKPRPTAIGPRPVLSRSGETPRVGYNFDRVGSSSR